jgi:medium-chain acyl-[acyl-carrier-protein] hydrolase
MNCQSLIGSTECKNHAQKICRQIDLMPHRTIKLFCLPYAGGSASIYRNWQSQVPSWLQICPIELPGRGGRSVEALPRSIPEVAHEIASKLQPYRRVPFALFGHSMGAAIAYEAARNLEIAGINTLCSLIVSGARAPFLDHKKPGISNLSDPEFVEHLRGLNGTPAEVLANAELMAVVLPVLRSDFANCERYRPENIQPLRVPITALAGDEDLDVPIADVESWGTLTIGGFRAITFQGDHFFINSSRSAVIAAVSDTLLNTNVDMRSISRISRAPDRRRLEVTGVWV